MSNARTLASLIDTNNKIQVPSGGIAFTDLDSSNDATTANEAYVLGQDGYEEGTWTPALERLTSSNYTYSRQDGFYTKIGNIVHVQFAVTVSAITAQGSRFLMITGLPFTAKNSTIQFSGGAISTQSCISGEPCSSLGVEPSYTFIVLFALSNPTINGGVLGENGAASVTVITGNISGAITYEVD